jgi:COP9 signalosome complex subunit 1
VSIFFRFKMASFDLEQYISHYPSAARIQRLIHIWEHSPTTAPLATEAARMCLCELRRGRNTAAYRSACQLFQTRSLPIPVDEAWVSQVDDASSRHLEKLEMDLSSSKTHLIKESIRLAFSDLGAFHYERGDLNASLKSYVRSREYCTNAKQILEMCLNVIRVALELSNMALVNQYIGKAEQSAEAAKDKRDIGKLRVAAGLANLDARKYRNAARKFVETPPELGNGYAEVMSAADIASFGGLCALASFDRHELKTKVIDNAAFKHYLELVPEVREIIKDFYDSRYTTCLNALERLKELLLLDIYLRPHVTALYEHIRQRALKQYVSPFMSVNLNKMAQSFNTTTPLLEKEVAQLIMDGEIQARIDSHNKVLYARRDNERVVTFEKALEVGRDFVYETEANIRRLSMLRADFQVRPPRSQHASSTSGPSAVPILAR